MWNKDSVGDLSKELAYKLPLGKSVEKCRRTTLIPNIYLLNPSQCISASRHGFTRGPVEKHIDMCSAILWWFASNIIHPYRSGNGT